MINVLDIVIITTVIALGNPLKHIKQIHHEMYVWRTCNENGSINEEESSKIDFFLYHTELF